MARTSGRLFDDRELPGQQFSERSGDVLPRCLVDLLSERALLLIDGGQGGDVRFQRDMQISFVHADVDVLGEPAHQSIRLAQAGAALEL